MQDEVESELFLNVVVRECETILELLSKTDEMLLVWRNIPLGLNLHLDIDDYVR
jgi:hypothetical protein